MNRIQTLAGIVLLTSLAACNSKQEVHITELTFKGDTALYKGNNFTGNAYDSWTDTQRRSVYYFENGMISLAYTKWYENGAMSKVTRPIDLNDPESNLEHIEWHENGKVKLKQKLDVNGILSSSEEFYENNKHKNVTFFKSKSDDGSIGHTKDFKLDGSYILTEFYTDPPTVKEYNTNGTLVKEYMDFGNNSPTRKEYPPNILMLSEYRKDDSQELMVDSSIESDLNPKFKRVPDTQWTDPIKLDSTGRISLLYTSWDGYVARFNTSYGEKMFIEKELYFSESPTRIISITLSKGNVENVWKAEYYDVLIGARVFSWNGKEWGLEYSRDSIGWGHFNMNAHITKAFIKETHVPFLLLSLEKKEGGGESGYEEIETEKVWLNIDDAKPIYRRKKKIRYEGRASGNAGFRRMDQGTVVQDDKISKGYDYYTLSDNGPISVMQLADLGKLPKDSEVLSNYVLKFKYGSNDEVSGFRLEWSVPKAKPIVEMQGEIYLDKNKNRWYAHGHWVSNIYNIDRDYDMGKVVKDYNAKHPDYGAAELLNLINNPSMNLTKCVRCKFGVMRRNVCDQCGMPDSKLLNSMKVGNNTPDILNCPARSHHKNIESPYSCHICSYVGTYF